MTLTFSVINIIQHLSSLKIKQCIAASAMFHIESGLPPPPHNHLSNRASLSLLIHILDTPSVGNNPVCTASRAIHSCIPLPPVCDR